MTNEMTSTSESHSNLCFLTIQQASELLRRRELSPVELTRAFLERIDSIDGDLHAYITVLADTAMAGAQAAEAAISRGDYIGPLHGIPIALKDLYATDGVRTSANSNVLKDWVPSYDATTTAKLKSAGAILLGKLTMHEFALGGPDDSNPFPAARNPWNLEYMPGGSSSGSGVAVAAGLCMGSLGSCTGGSIRGPASFCSIVGFKATYGRVSRFGVVPLSWSLDHCGPMTWTVEDAAIMLQAIAGYDPQDPATSGVPVPDYTQSLREDIRGLTIGVPRDYFFAEHPDIDSEITAIVDKGISALQDLGARVEEVTIPSLEAARAAHPVIMLGEAFAYHERNLKSRPQDFGGKTRDRFYIGGLFTLSDYVQAQRVRSQLKREFAQVMQHVDLIVTPSTNRPPDTFEWIDPTSRVRSPSFSSPFNMTGLPAISVPCGFTSAGLPVGMQIVGRPFGEATVLRASYTYQQHALLFQRRPPI